jgi:hypothetical protein
MRALLFCALLLFGYAHAACTPNSGRYTVGASTATLEVCASDGSTWASIGGAAAALPAGMIAFFNGVCPAGWTEVTAARGRIVVGLPASGTLAGTVGTAFTDLQDKSVTPTFTGTPFSGVINHTHAVNVTDGGHSHPYKSQSATTGAATTYEHGVTDTSSTGANEGVTTDSATTGITATTSNPAGGVASITPAGTVSAVAMSSIIATIQYRVCAKD